MTDEQTAKKIWDNLTFSSKADIAAIVRALQAARKAPAGYIIDDAGVVRKVLGTLPVTADGCVAGQSAHLYQIDDRAPGRWFDYYTGTLHADGWYSSREAAETAKEAQ